MADKYTVVQLDEVDDILGDYPGDMKMLKNPLQTEQVAVTFRRMPQHTGGKGSYGHRHKTQEEVIYVISGKLQVKLGDDILELGPNETIRIPQGVTQAVWNDEPEEVEMLIISNRLPEDDVVEYDEQFWPMEDSE